METCITYVLSGALRLLPESHKSLSQIYALYLGRKLSLNGTCCLRLDILFN